MAPTQERKATVVYESLAMAAEPSKELESVESFLEEETAPPAPSRRRLVLGLALCAAGAVAVCGALARAPCPATADLSGVIRADIENEPLPLGLDEHFKSANEVREAAHDAVRDALDFGKPRQETAEEAKERMLKAAKFVGGAAAVGALAKHPGLVLREVASKVDQVKKEAKAICVFNVLSATGSFARAAVNIKEAVIECEAGRPAVHKRVCGVDIGIAIGAIARVAAALSSAASFCAETLSVDALCSAGVTGLVAILAEAAASAGLTFKTCAPDSPFPEGGNPGTVGEYVPPYGLQLEAAANDTATGRRLWMGGGEDAMTTECVLDINQALFALGTASLFLTKSTEECKEPSPFLPKKLQEVFKAKCAQTVGTTIMGFSQAVQFLSLMSTHCPMSINNAGLCSAAISALMAALGGGVATGSTIDVACNKLQQKPLKALSRLLPPLRRLAEENGISEAAAISQEVGDADALWKSMGVHLDDPEWRKNFLQADAAMPDEVEDRLLKLMRPAPAQEASSSGWGLPASPFCKAN